jgi:hypothetical protein
MQTMRGRNANVNSALVTELRKQWAIVAAEAQRPQSELPQYRFHSPQELHRSRTAS